MALPIVLTGEVIAIAALIFLPPARFQWWPAAAVVPSPPPRQSTLPSQDDIMGGVRVDEYEAVTMVRVFGKAYTPTFLCGSAVSLTTNVLPLHLLRALLDQPRGLKLADIDVVSSGHRIRRGEE